MTADFSVSRLRYGLFDWIVDPAARTAQVFVLEGGRYAARDFGGAGDTLRVNILDGCVIDLSLVFDTSL